MEEQRQRQEDEARRTAVASTAVGDISSPAAEGESDAVPISAILMKPYCVTYNVFFFLFHIFVSLSVAECEDALLKVSVPNTDSATPALPDFSRMTEEEQIAYALQMSMQGSGGG